MRQLNMIKGKLLNANDNPIISNIIGKTVNPLDNETIKIVNSKGDIIIEYSGERVKFSLGDLIQEAVVLINHKKDLVKELANE